MTNAITPAVPVLHTERLILRGHTAADFPDSAATWGDADVTRHIGGRPFTPEESWARVLRYAGLWSLLGFGYWVVRERATDRFVGEVGFGNFKRETVPPLGDDPEAGWVLAPSAHGQGYATEAVLAALAWADANLAAPRTVCMIDPGNAASIRVAEKCGYRELTRATYKGEATTLYARPRP